MFDFAETTKDMTAVEILNHYRNLYYTEPQVTERGIVANAINDILPRMIVPPCKVWDTVYYLTTEYTEKELNVTDIFCGTVLGLCFDGTNIWISVKYTNGLSYYHKSTDFGKTVFLTREEAEKALEERRMI